jgi:hypothetical protein
MSTFSLQLLTFPYNEVDAFGSRVCIALKSYGTMRWGKGNKENEFKTISPQCVTQAELEYQINRLIKELETIKSQGKKFFKKELDKRAE